MKKPTRQKATTATPAAETPARSPAQRAQVSLDPASNAALVIDAYDMVNRKAPFPKRVCMVMLALQLATWACAGERPAQADGGPDAGADDAGAMAADASCQPSSDASEPASPPQERFDGGVPLDQLSYATGLAFCHYWNRCTALAPYVVSECVAAWTTSSGWNFWACSGEGDRQNCVGTTTRIPGGYPGADVLQAVDAGLTGYDSAQELTCLQAMEAQPCHGPDVWQDIPACSGVFYSRSDGGVPDAGPVGASGFVLQSCSHDSDCAGLVGADAGFSPGPGPYCVAGYCWSDPCGEFPHPGGPAGTGCSFVAAGQPCDSDPPFLGNSSSATPWGAPPVRACAPGLTCAGLTADGGLGTCGPGEDFGGPCVDGAVISGCRLGLVCECGTCHMPPSQGTCVASSCEAGVAWCDALDGNQCRPTQQLGDTCMDSEQCASELACDSSSRTCVPVDQE